MTNLILEIGDAYDDMFSFEHDFKIIMNPEFKDTSFVVPTSSVIAQPSAQYNYHDRYIDSLVHSAMDFCLVYGVSRYYNDFLSELERATIASKYFHIIKRNSVLERYDTNVRAYYNVLSAAEEKLIELWRLDLYGDIEESGVGLGSLIVEKRRNLRNKVLKLEDERFFRNNYYGFR